MAVTSRDPAEPGLALEDWTAGGLIKPSWFKPLVATLSAGIVVRRLGSLTERDRRRLARVLGGMLDPAVRL